MPLVKTVPSQPEDTARRQQAAPRYPLEINWTGGDAGEFSQHREQRPSRLESVRVALTNLRGISQCPTLVGPSHEGFMLIKPPVSYDL